MTSSLIVLCPGQGAQFVGMGKAWYDAAPEARAVFDEADAQLGGRLGAPLSELCFSGPAERLNRTDISQPAIFTCGIACFRAMMARRNMGAGELPVRAAAGLSLGEYTALTVAGAMTFADGLELVTLRGRAMQDAAESAGVAGKGGMVALIGGDEAQARDVCTKTLEGHPTDILVCANFNAPGQIVLSGAVTACARAVEVAGAMGLRATMLQVAGAFHSPLMQPAADRLLAALAKTTITAPRCPVISNVTAEVHGPQGAIAVPDSIRRRLVEQLTNPVRWAESCARLVAMAQGAEAEWHELCPGKTLTGLMRRIDKSVKVTAQDEPG